jgi:hypothetical protein
MIRETTNPKYQQPAQHSGKVRILANRNTEFYEGDFVSASSRDMSKGIPPQPNFVDRKPHEAPSREPEPRDRPLGSSMWILDQDSSAPLWFIKDRTTHHIFAQVRGSLPWIVDQMKLLADQLGGQVNELYYQRARDN